MCKIGAKIGYTTVRGNTRVVTILKQHEGGSYRVAKSDGTTADVYICYGQGKVYTIQRGRQRTVGYL